MAVVQKVEPVDLEIARKYVEGRRVEFDDGRIKIYVRSPGQRRFTHYMTLRQEQSTRAKTPAKKAPTVLMHDHRVYPVHVDQPVCEPMLPAIVNQKATHVPEVTQFAYH
ncbi:MAG: hypothetical protein PHY92_09990 [Alphaproteobacteria bacterium]|nr:hypothetical protein [Alphaproteobacteria bacterium]